MANYLSDELLEVSFLIPEVKDSTREPHQPIAWSILQDTIRHRFPKGHTGPEVFHRAPDLVPGEYTEKEDDPPTKDRSRRYTLALPHRDLDDLREILGRAAVTFDQRSIYLCVAGTVEFVPPGNSGLL